MVVFTDKDDGQVPQGCHVQGFILLSLIGSAISITASDTLLQMCISDAGLSGLQCCPNCCNVQVKNLMPSLKAEEMRFQTV